MPIEAGGVNSMLPIAAAARLGIPMVDVDGMGRAFPELQMVTFTIGGASATPMAFIDEKGNSGILDTITNKWTEDIARAATMTMGGTLTIALFCMDVDTCKQYGVHGIVTRSEELGRAIRTAKDEAAAAGLTPEGFFLKFTGGHKLFKGKISDVLRETRGAFNFGRVVLEGIGEDRGSQAFVDFQNENLSCVVDGQIKATVPDLICLVAWSASTCGARRRVSTSWGRATSASIPTISPSKSAARGRRRKAMYKLGIDVGGTNTDAVLIDENLNVVAAVKNPTSDDIYTGIMGAVDAVLADSGVDRAQIAQAMLGTTQCTNAIVERKDLAPIAILRIGAPSTTASAWRSSTRPRAARSSRA